MPLRRPERRAQVKANFERDRGDITAFGARRVGAWLDFEGIATPTENSAFGQKAWRPPKPRPWHLSRRNAFYRDTNFIFDRFCYHLARLKFIFVRI